jgi:hypothetical protein
MQTRVQLQTVSLSLARREASNRTMSAIALSKEPEIVVLVLLEVGIEGLDQTPHIWSSG